MGSIVRPVASTFLKILSKTANLRLALFMALALLFAQLGAQAHAYSHLHAGSHVTDQLYDHGSVCADCLSFAPLLATAGGTGQIPFVMPQGIAPAPSAAIRTLIARTPTPAFRSRAPPSNQ
jgi:hypothetical protein